jgi:parallel beta-helix repeat protein
MIRHVLCYDPPETVMAMAMTRALPRLLAAACIVASAVAQCGTSGWGTLTGTECELAVPVGGTVDITAELATITQSPLTKVTLMFADGTTTLSDEVTMGTAYDISVDCSSTEDRCIIVAKDMNTEAFKQPSTGSTKTYTFKRVNIRGGKYGIRTYSSAHFEIEDSECENNGWDGTAATAETQGAYATLWASSSTSSGGCIRIQNSVTVSIIDLIAHHNARGIRLQDISGSGSITGSVAHDNLESGIYLAASSYNGLTGCNEIQISESSSLNNKNNGILVGSPYP